MAHTSTTTNASAAILDAAERVFALHGFDGASMRQISREAGVAQALLHYHFGTKEKLYETMFARRSDAINTSRTNMLDRLFGGQVNPTLEDLLDALLRPTIVFGHENKAGNFFSRILAASANANDERSRMLIASHYDDTAIRFIAAFQRVLPEMEHGDAVWAYMFTIGVGMTIMAATGRAGRLSDGMCNDTQVEAVMDRLIPFVCAGVRALTLPHQT